MKITRQSLIDICDKFLEDQVDKPSIKEFAWNAITSSEFEIIQDEIVKDIIFEWDSEDLNFEFTKTNFELWKGRLLTGHDLLTYYNSWNSHIKGQREICFRYNSTWRPINKKLNVGVSIDLEKDPIHGLRHPSEKGTSGWFIWSGEYSESTDFFRPMCAEHLLQVRPDIIKYLGLDIGFRFISDKDGFEDVWYDEKLRIL